MFCVFALPLAALKPAGQDEDQFRFARSLFDAKEYYRAIGEFDRLCYFFPQSKFRSEAMFLTGLSYYRAGQYDQARRSFSSLASNTDFAFRAAAISADSLFRQDRFDASAAGYSALSVKFPDKEPDLLWSMAWPDLMNRDFNASLGLYDLILEKYPSFERKKDVEYLRASVLKLKKFRKLSPGFAAALSAVLPGAGQFYTRRPGDGLVAFGAVAVLGVSSYLLWRYYEHKEVAVVVTAAAAFFYGGNIYSAWSSAKKYNLLYYKRNLDGLRDNYWSDHDE